MPGRNCRQKPVVIHQAPGEGWQANEVNVTGNWKKSDLCYVVAES